MAYDIGPRIGIDGEEDFRKSLMHINQNIKTLGSEMGSVVSSFAEGEKSEEAMAAQTDVLTRQIEEQKKKLKLLTEGMEKSADKFGENDTKTLKWKQAVYEATTQLNKMEKQLNETGDEVDDIGKDFDKGAKSALSFGDVLKANVIGSAITSGLGAVVDGIKNIAGAMKDTVVDSAAYADEILTLSTNTGLSTDTLQELKYMAELTDTSLETITGGMAKLTKNMANAQGGTGAAAEAFEALGVAITNEDGTLRNNQEVFQDVIDALAAMENETQRDAYAMQIFGKSAQDLNSFMAQGSEGIAALAAEAHNVGAVLDEETLGSLGSVDDALQRFDGAISSVKNNIIGNFAPAIATGLESLNSFLTGEIDASQFVENISGIVFQAAEGLIANLPVVMEAGGKILSSIIDGVRNLFPTILEVAGEILGNLFDGLVSGFPLVLQTGAEMLTTLVTGIANSLPEMIPAAVNAVMGFVAALTKPDMLGSLIDAGLLLIVKLAEGLIKAIPDLVQTIPTIIKNIVTTIVESVPKLLAAGVQLIVTLGAGLLQAIPELAANIPKIIAAIVGGITSGISKIKEIGKNIVTGLWEGIKSMWEWLKEKFFSLFDGLTSGINKLLGIHSPSRVFAGIGGFMAEGLGEGFGSEMKAVQRDIDRSMEDLIPDVSGTVSVMTKSDSAVGFAAGTGSNVDIAAAFREALAGMEISMSGRRVGSVVTRQQNADTRASGVPVMA